MLLILLLIAGCSLAIYYFGDWFANASTRIGDHYKLPRGVKGATLDAINSSLPELMVALFAIIFFGRFDVGVATIAGSAAFNLLVIPALCALLAPVALKIGGHVLDRDGLFFFVSLVLFIGAVWYAKEWGVLISLMLLAVYALYINRFITHTKAHKQVVAEKRTRIPRDVFILIVSMVGIAGASFILVDQAILLATALNIHPILIAFTVIAGATSIPDTVVSVVNARKGSGDDAISNALGSNTFNILVGLPIPVLAHVLFVGEPVTVAFANIEILFGLLIATIVVLYFIANNKTLSKKEGAILLGVYILFMTYVIVLALHTPV